jgi:hypothetical protein
MARAYQGIAQRARAVGNKVCSVSFSRTCRPPKGGHYVHHLKGVPVPCTKRANTSTARTNGGHGRLAVFFCSFRVLRVGPLNMLTNVLRSRIYWTITIGCERDFLTNRAQQATIIAAIGRFPANGQSHGNGFRSRVHPPVGNGVLHYLHVAPLKAHKRHRRFRRRRIALFAEDGSKVAVLVNLHG